MSHIFERKGILRLLVFAVLLILLPYTLIAAERKRNTFYDAYVEKYSDLAISHMKKYKVPASITLAQGLLESGAGRSSLTLRSNNHFGIKCHNGWKGESVIAADDTPNDCFRKYKKAEDSFDDHSRFLSEKQRYSDLFSLDITDYRGWARGLQKAGYATDKAYANKLIKLIEDYELYRYDKKGGKRDVEREEIQIITPVVPSGVRHIPYKTHGLVYVVAQRDDSYASIASEFGFKVKDLCEYNEVPDNFPIQEGDLIYFQKKKKKADKPYYEHVVQVGESMYSISQLYGIKVNNLYKMNKRDFEYVPVEGDILRLR
ncbi:flagellum-specific peptidoglycan hydrolase FlgJ [Dysgonomonas alginatilytica]|uniref:Peptidoglycan hydrolase n=1 Tax=Dysgonomonas alginatilytica TaxID=1605892 RepID=A0A2V3PUU0_9BACT|nr:glucosaminidase domain-containing protein [Dysgonomonas alginatilytica]PXV68872.1 flagellum-specific peptidoglycan hydrolase FlgJ [Dysgonomonas alginatilytica]